MTNASSPGGLRRFHFGYFDLFWACVGLVSTLLDLGTDINTITKLYLASHVVSASLLLACRLTADIVVQFFSLAWLYDDWKERRVNQNLEFPRPSWVVKVLHCLQLGLIYRFVWALRKGWKAIQDGGEGLAAEAVYRSTDITMLRLFKTFIENAPQLVLLIGRMVQAERVNLMEGLSAVVCLFSISWILLDYHKALRISLNNKLQLQGYLASFVYLLWNLLLVAPRVVTLGFYVAAVGPMAAVHVALWWFAMLVWARLQDTDFTTSKKKEFVYNSVVAVIWIFSWFNVSKTRTLWRSIIYHFAVLVDIIIMIMVYYVFLGEDTQKLVFLCFVSVVFICYTCGIAVRCVYYRRLHPSVTVATVEFVQPEVQLNIIDVDTDGPMEPFTKQVNKRITKFVGYPHLPNSSSRSSTRNGSNSRSRIV
ncbi:XK-related protein 8-like [Petromyzon marinus]|uniref:XK-related protein 8-like n=1 Tax=Petromyzon marinus TaxID=7757 RepID=UPI003F6E8572